MLEQLLPLDQIPQAGVQAELSPLFTQCLQFSQNFKHRKIARNNNPHVPAEALVQRVNYFLNFCCFTDSLGMLASNFGQGRQVGHVDIFIVYVVFIDLLVFNG